MFFSLNPFFEQDPYSIENRFEASFAIFFGAHGTVNLRLVEKKPARASSVLSLPLAIETIARYGLRARTHFP